VAGKNGHAKILFRCSYNLTLSSTVVTSYPSSGFGQGGILGRFGRKKCFGLKVSHNTTKYFNYIFMKHRCIAIFSYAKFKIHFTASLSKASVGPSVRLSVCLHRASSSKPVRFRTAVTTEH